MKRSQCPRSKSVSAPSSVTKTSPCWYGFIVPASTLMYGSSFWIETLRPRAFRSRPREAAVMPLPSELTTPPVKKIYFAISGRGRSPVALEKPRSERSLGIHAGYADACRAHPVLGRARFSALSPSWLRADSDAAHRHVSLRYASGCLDVSGEARVIVTDRNGEVRKSSLQKFF